MKKKTRSAPHSFLRRVCMIVIGPLANFKAVTGPPTQEVPAEDDGLTGVAGGSPSLGPLSTEETLGPLPTGYSCPNS